MSSGSLDAEQAASDLLFGPWMSVSRRRISPGSVRKEAVHDSGTPPVAPVPSSSAAARVGDSAEGWSSPGKLARRRNKVSAGVAVVPGLQSGGLAASGQAEADKFKGQSAGVPAGSSRAGLVATVTIEDQVSSGSPKVISEPQLLNLKNPFTLLNTGNVDCGPAARLDANPGPSKRARPEEHLHMRPISKNGNRIGRGSYSKSKDMKMMLSTANPLIPGKDPINLAGGSDKASRSQVIDCGVNLGQTSKGEDRRHDSSIVCLKSAIMDQSMESALPVAEPLSSSSVSEAGLHGVDNIQLDCTTQAVVNGMMSIGHSSDQAMMDDQGGSHPPLITK